MDRLCIGMLGVSALLSGALAVVAYRRNRTPGAWWFGLAMLSATLWSSTAAMEYLTADVATSVLWSKVQYVAVVTLAPLWFLFARAYARGESGWGTQARRLSWLWALPGLVLGLVWTNEIHGLVWPRILPATPALGPRPVYVHGVAVWAIALYSYALLIAGSLELLRTAMRSPTLYRRQVALLIGAAIVPVVGNLVYLTGHSPLPALDTTPISFSIAGLLAAWCILRYRMLRRDPIRAESLLLGLADGAIMLGADGCIEEINAEAYRLLGVSGTAVGRQAVDILARWPEMTQQWLLEDGSSELGISGAATRSYLSVRRIPLTDRHGVRRHRLLLFRDLTSQREAEQAWRRRDAILEAVRYAATAFLRERPEQPVTDRVLARLGEAIDVSRVYVFENSRRADGALLMTQRHEWCAAGTTPQVGNPQLREVAYADVGATRWAEVLAAGEVIRGCIRDFPACERAALEPQAIAALAAVPIFVQDAWWGFIGFDECRQPREWTDAEIEALRTAAETLGAAIERHRAGARLRESEERYRRVVESQAEMICRFLPDTTLTFANGAFCQALGKTPASLVGQPFLSLVPEAERAVLKQHLASLTPACPTVSYEHAVPLPGGGTAWQQWTDVALFGHDGKVVEFQSVGRDVTALRRAEAEKARLQEALFHAQKMDSIGRLAGGVAHDFNNQLQAILGFSDLILATTGEDDPRYEAVQEIIMASTQAARLTGQLLAFSRKQMIRPQVLDLNGALQDMERMLRRVIGEDYGVELTLAPGRLLVQADIGQLEQVVVNLVVNARDAMPHGGVIRVLSDTVVLSAAAAAALPDARPGEFVRMAVADTGTGIAPEVRERLFEPFFTTKPKGRGVGMGLPTAYGIAQQHGGWLGVVSTLGSGATFTLYLPVPPPGAEPEPVAAGVTVGTDYAFERILVVEDEESVRKLANLVLQEAGYEVVAAASAAEAVRLFDEHHGQFDLIFSDVVLPDRNGVDLVDGLLALKPDLRVLLASGYTDEKSRWRAIQGRNWRLLHKPYAAATLLTTLREILS